MSTGQVDIQNSERVARETASEVQVGKVGVGAIAFESVQTAIKHDVLGLAAEIAYRSALALVPFLLILAALLLAGVGVLRSWVRRCAVTISTASA